MTVERHDSSRHVRWCCCSAGLAEALVHSSSVRELQGQKKDLFLTSSSGFLKSISKLL